MKFVYPMGPGTPGPPPKIVVITIVRGLVGRITYKFVNCLRVGLTNSSLLGPSKDC